MPDAATTTYDEAKAKVIASLKDMPRKPMKRATKKPPARKRAKAP